MTLNKVKFNRILRLSFISTLLFICLFYNNTSNEPKLPNVTFSIKTTRKYHNSRIMLLLDTWISNTKSNVFIISDTSDLYLQNQLSNIWF